MRARTSSSRVAVQGDVASMADLDRLYATVKEQRGRVDVLFANAGGGEFAALGAITEVHFDHLFNTNVKGLLFTVQKALPLFQDRGSIILMASVAGSKAMEAFSVYGATKAAVRSFARSWAVELKSRRIRVNAVSPGPIDTPVVGKLGLSDASQGPSSSWTAAWRRFDEARPYPPVTVKSTGTLPRVACE